MGHPELAKRGQEKMRIKMMNEGSQKEKKLSPCGTPSIPTDMHHLPDHQLYLQAISNQSVSRKLYQILKIHPPLQLLPSKYFVWKKTRQEG